MTEGFLILDPVKWREVVVEHERKKEAALAQTYVEPPAPDNVIYLAQWKCEHGLAE